VVKESWTLSGGGGGNGGRWDLRRLTGAKVPKEGLKSRKVHRGNFETDKKDQKALGSGGWKGGTTE